MSVYRILNSLDLEKYYTLEANPGNKPEASNLRYQNWDDEKLKAPCVVFKNEEIEIIQLQIPSMHCSSCIWILEQLHKFLEEIQNVTVYFSKKTIQISYYHKQISLSKIAVQLNKIGYSPLLLPLQSNHSKNQKKLWYQIGIAGFAFGNCMFLSFPSYFENQEFWLTQYQPFFDWIQFGLNIPVLVYAAKDYFIAVIYDGIFLLLLVLMEDYPLDKFAIITSLLNPIDLSRTLILLKLDISALLGYTGAVFKKFFCTDFSFLVSFLVLTLWVIFPVWRMVSVSKKKDF